MKTLLLDANVLVRFLVQDDPRQGAAATALFAKAGRREITLRLDALALAEAAYVLIGRYGRSRVEVANVLLAIIQSAGIEALEADVVTDALRRFAAINADFADAWLAARAARHGLDVVSFDRDFDKFKDIQRVEPAI